MADKRDLKIRPHRTRAASPSPTPTADTASPAPETPPRKKKRRRHGRSVVWPILFRLLLTAALVMLVVLAWRNRDRLVPAAVSEWVENLFTGGEEGDGYPVTMTGSGVTDMQPVSSQVALLTDTALTVYNTSGKAVASYSHTYTKPLLQTDGGYMLVTESGGTRYFLATRREQIYSGQTDKTLRCGAVSADGRVALVTDSSQSYMSEVTVLEAENTAAKELFHWYSTDLMVVDVAFSANGKQLAVLGLSAQNGELSSTVQIFALAGKTEAALHSYMVSGPMMTALHYYDNGCVAVVGDEMAFVYDPDKETAETFDYAQATLLGYAFSNRGVAVVTRPYGETRGGEVTVLTPAGKTASSVSFDGAFRHVSAAENGAYVLTDSRLLLVDTVGVARETAVTSDGLQTVDLNGNPLLLTLTALDRVEWK